METPGDGHVAGGLRHFLAGCQRTAWQSEDRRLPARERDSTKESDCPPSRSLTAQADSGLCQVSRRGREGSPPSHRRLIYLSRKWGPLPACSCGWRAAATWAVEGRYFVRRAAETEPPEDTCWTGSGCCRCPPALHAPREFGRCGSRGVSCWSSSAVKSFLSAHSRTSLH